MALVELEIRDRVGWLTLNRPEKLNAFNAPLLDAFEAGIDELDTSPDVSVIVIRGGGRAFSVGYDVDRTGDYTSSNGDGEREHAWDDWQKLDRNIDRWLHVVRLKKPVIASLHGHVLGGATMLAASTDITVIADNANVGWPSVPLGGGLIGVYSLMHLGAKRAAEMSYIAGSHFDGKQAVEWGWANHSVPEDELFSFTENLAKRIAQTPVEMLILKKAAIRRAIEHTFNFTNTVRSGAEFDAIAHDSRSIEQMTQIINELGLKGAIKQFTKAD